MRRTFDFGKISYTTYRKANTVTIEVELRKKGGNNIPEYNELSVCGEIWDCFHNDIVYGGQCLDTILLYKDQLNDEALFMEIYNLWKKYHLNSMHAGTPEQEAAISKWEEKGNRYSYESACKMLKEQGLYEVPYSGHSTSRVYDNELYRYGSAWLVEEIPKEVVSRIEELLSR